MNITLVRFKDSGRTTFGKFFIDGKFECFTLEDAFHEPKIHGQTRIPAGTYTIDLRFSPHFTPIYGHQMLWLKDVPNYQYVLIHKGNTAADTEGCILVGQEIAGETITRSTLAYEALYPKVSQAVNNGKGVTITLVDHDRP